MEKSAAAYQKFRLILRVLSGNLYDFNQSEAIRCQNLKPIDQYMMLKCAKLIGCYHDDMNSLSFHTAIHRLLNFAHDEVSTFYLSSIKDRLYCDEAKSESRKSAQTSLKFIFDNLFRSLQPFTPHLCHEMEVNWESSHQVSTDFEEILNNRCSEHAKFNEVFGVLKNIRSALLTKFGNDLKVLEKCDVILAPSEVMLNILKLTESCAREVIGCRVVQFKSNYDSSKGFDSQNGFTSLSFSDDNNNNMNGINVAFALNNKSEKCPRCRLFWSDATENLCLRCEKVVNLIDWNLKIVYEVFGFVHCRHLVVV